jgi:predicted CXXCH cytochrome family protein
MTRKTLKRTLVAVSAFLVAVAAGVGFASTKTVSAEVPEYLGNQACLGCHMDKFTSWSDSLHGTFVTEIKSAADLPADPAGLAPELQVELQQARYIFHGNSFLTPDLKTGELKYVGVQFNTTTKAYEASTRKGSSFDANCGGCHAGKDYQSGIRASIGVGCESCHGPGRDHVLGKGDISKISASADPSQNCIACHSGYNQAPNSTRYPVGYRPAMDLAKIGFVAAKVDPSAPPQAMHHKGAYPQWAVSGHAKATDLLAAHGDSYLSRQECIKCHSTTAGLIIAKGGTYDPKTDYVNDGVSCVACHDPHGSNEPGQLKQNAQALCLSCHSVGRGAPGTPTIGTTRAPHSPQGDMLAGTGAIGIAPTTGAHTGQDCIACHMTGANHEFKVLKPQDVIGTNTKDTCTTCHTNSTPESRGAYLELWGDTIQGRLANIQADVDKIDAALKANPNALTAAQNTTYVNARANFWMVQKDGSNGAHNFEYAIKILTQAQKDINAVKAALK